MNDNNNVPTLFDLREIIIEKSSKIIEASPQITMKNPQFSKLTAAEKLNDSEFRSIIYRTYPDEPTCRCKSVSGHGAVSNHHEESSVNFHLQCPGGCRNFCCSTRRLPDNRVKGGGSNDSNGRNIGDKNLNPVITSRCWCSDGEKFLNNMNKNSQSIRDSNIEIDRLLQLYDNAKNYADSIGKVSGTTCLDSMNPSDCPYRKSYRRIINERSPIASNEFNPLRSKVNDLQREKVHDLYVKFQPSTSTDVKIMLCPASTNCNETDNEETLPEIVSEKFEQVIGETSPCGQSVCKSKCKKKIDSKTSINKNQSGVILNEVIKVRSSQQNHKHNKLREPKKRKTPIGPGEDILLKSKKEQKIKYVYFAGNTYPGSIYGHKNCNDRPERVPGHMGWLWTQFQPVDGLKPRVGWKPGAISQIIQDIISEGKIGLKRSHRKPNSASSSSLNRKLRAKKFGEDEEKMEPPPTLHIQKKGGNYYIIMYPTRQETDDIPKLEEPIKPLQIKILKNLEKHSDDTSSAASDLDIEFSTPAALNRYKKRPDVIYIETQVKQQDIIDAYKCIGNEEDKSKDEKRVKKKRKKKQL